VFRDVVRFNLRLDWVFNVNDIVVSTNLAQALSGFLEGKSLIQCKSVAFVVADVLLLGWVIQFKSEVDVGGTT